MANRQTLIIDGTDYSNYIQQNVDVNETPIYVNGENAGNSKAATAIWDRKGVRYSNSFLLKPLPRSKFDALRKATIANSVTVRVTTSRADAPISIEAQITMTAYSYATTHSGERIYTGASITIEAKDAEQ